MESLNKALLTSDHQFPADVKVSPWQDLPEKVLQFGEGNFLRGFVDWMIHQMNKQGLFNGKVCVVQPITFGAVCDMLNAQNGLYTMMLRGVQNGEVLEDKEIINSISRCINPYADFAAYLECAKNPDLRFIISNTTEAGIAYSPDDKPTDMPPASFPGKLTVFLHARYQAFNGDPTKGMVIIPCELIEKNGTTLRAIVLRLAKEWGYEPEFITWLEKSNYFLSTLVDRIVTGYPRAEVDAITEKLGYQDNVLNTSEPFHFWVIEGSDFSEELPLAQAGLDVIWTPDMTPYRTRKVRILNGAHTMTVLGAYLSGLDTVKEFMDDETIHTYMNKGLFDEIIPTLDLPKEELVSYTAAVAERFANPFIRHMLLDISLNSTSKFKSRCLPSLLTYVERKGELPKVLTFGLAALIAFYRGEGIEGRSMTGTRCANGATNTYKIQDDVPVLEFFEKIWKEYVADTDAKALVTKVLANTAMWGQDLNAVEGLTDLIAAHLENILANGAKAAIASVL
jgi:tagaturonate reductase